MDMKNKILILIFLSLPFSNLYANEKDSLRIYLMESDSVFFVDLVFENISKDTIIIPTTFRNNLPFDIESFVGIRILSFFNHEQFVLQNYSHIQDKYLNLYNKNFYILPPKEKIAFNVNIKFYFDLIKLSNDDEIGVKIILDFYYVPLTRDINTEPIKKEIWTNYVNVKGEYQENENNRNNDRNKKNEK